jgi:hypothetical protein
MSILSQICRSFPSLQAQADKRPERRKTGSAQADNHPERRKTSSAQAR